MQNCLHGYRAVSEGFYIGISAGYAEFKLLESIFAEMRNEYNFAKLNIFTANKKAGTRLDDGLYIQNQVIYFFFAAGFAFAAALAGFAVRSLSALPGVNLPFVLAAILISLPV